MSLQRRDFLKLAGVGAGAVYISSLGFSRSAFGKDSEDFYFVQLSDSHWGYEGPKFNPEAATTLKKTVDAVNALSRQPDFIVFTGDLTHQTDDEAVRNKRMLEFKEIVKNLKVKDVRYIPGEHDAANDAGKAFKAHFGATHYVFAHKGVTFIALDNVSDKAGALGTEQLDWLKGELAKLKKDAPIVVITHRPLFDLMPEWDWMTKDGKTAIDMLMPFKNVMVFYGHIHNEAHNMTGHIAHHSAKSLMFALPAAGSQPKKFPIPWDAAKPYAGLGFRGVDDNREKVTITEIPLS